MSKIAVIKTGGKQYFVKAGDELKIEKLPKEIGDSFEFTEVLITVDDKNNEIKIGKPFIEDAKVTAKVLEQARAKKIRVVHYKNKTRYHKVYGHRQPFTKVKIEKIN